MHQEIEERDYVSNHLGASNEGPEPPLVHKLMRSYNTTIKRFSKSIIDTIIASSWI